MNNLAIDVFGNVILEREYQNTLCNAVYTHVMNPNNWKSFSGITAQNYNSFITNNIVSNYLSGWYVIHRVDELNHQLVLTYVGASTLNMNSRFAKFFRTIFEKKTSGDVPHKAANKYKLKYGDDVSNLYAAYYRYPNNLEYMGENCLREVEGSLIKRIDVEYPGTMLNEMTTPRNSKMRESIKKSREQGFSTLDDYFVD